MADDTGASELQQLADSLITAIEKRFGGNAGHRRPRSRPRGLPERRGAICPPLPPAPDRPGHVAAPSRCCSSPITASGASSTSTSWPPWLRWRTSNSTVRSPSSPTSWPGRWASGRSSSTSEPGRPARRAPPKHCERRARHGVWRGSRRRQVVRAPKQDRLRRRAASRGWRSIKGADLMPHRHRRRRRVGAGPRPTGWRRRNRLLRKALPISVSLAVEGQRNSRDHPPLPANRTDGIARDEAAQGWGVLATFADRVQAAMQ